MKKYEALARHPLAIAGAIIATATAVVFLALVIGMLTGMFEESPYAGLVVFLAVPALFVIALLLIPAGMKLQQRKLARDPSAAATDWPVVDFRLPRVRRITLLFVALTAVNVVIVLVAGYGSLHWMESPTFCGQVCHTPMHPQFTAWQDGSHGQVACVRCHIGEGARGFVHAKVSGLRQLAHVVTGSYPRPVPPGAHMLPGAQAYACSTCHQPGRIAGDRIRVIREYGEDEGNSETTTILQMHVGAGSATGRAIHWHADPANRVEFISTDEGRQTIPYVKVTRADGQVKEYRTAEATDGMVSAGELRPMECADCHNQVGHPISATPEKVVDRAIETGQVSRSLAFARREGVRLLKASYPTQEAGVDAIDRGFREFYMSRTGADPKEIARTVASLQEVYRRNVFPTMKVTWGAYPDNRGHVVSPGCVRCHDDSHTAKDGSTINGDCEYCHKQIEKPE